MPVVMVAGKCLALITIRSVDPDLNTRMGHFIAEQPHPPICNTMSRARASGTRPAISDAKAIPTLMSNPHP